MYLPIIILKFGYAKEEYELTNLIYCPITTNQITNYYYANLQICNLKSSPVHSINRTSTPGIEESGFDKVS